jgi:DNA repair protein SbcC/Rad50
VWIERLEIAGFKRLAGPYDFSPGLTLVLGPNEAGKSSLGEALVRSVWGFSRSERRRRADGSAWERCRPWDGGPWRMVATIVDRDSRRFRAEWDFEEHSVRLLDAVTGEDLSAVVAGKRGDVSLGAYIAGISADDFWQACSFDQHTLTQVQNSDSLVNALQRSVESVETDVGVSDADGRLKDFLNSQIGARGDNYKPLPSGQLQRDLNEQALLVTQIEAAQHEEVEIASFAQDLRRRQLQQAVLEEARVEVERGILLREAADAHAIWTEAARQRDLALAAPREDRPPDEQLVVEARQRFGAIDEADRAIDELERRALLVADEVAELRAQEAAAGRVVESFASVSHLDLAGEATVRELTGVLRSLGADAVDVDVEVPAPDPTLERYRTTRAELLPLAGRPEIAWNSSRIAAAATLAVISLGLGVLVSPVGFVGLVIAGIAAATARSVKTGGALVERLREEFGVENINELEQAVRDEDQALAQARAAAQTTAAAESARVARRAQLVSELADALDQVSVPAGPLESRSARYLADCSKRRELDRQLTRLHELRLQLQQRTEPERELVGRRDERDAQREAVAETLGRLAIDGSDLAAARSVLDQRVIEGRALADRRAASAGAREALDALLAGRSVADLELELNRANARLEDHTRSYGDISPAEGELDDLRVQLGDTDRRLSDASNLAAALEAQISERENRLPNLPELRERVAAVEVRVEKLQRALEAIRIAREALREAARLAHRNFAPHLQRALERSLPLFTANRYREVMIGDDLSISVVAPETGNQVPADCLSFGTQDQIYLVQRLEIAKLLIPSAGAVPLLLDEPFAEFDQDRERSAVRLLCQEAQTRQIILLSNDSRLVDLVRDVQGDPHVIELDAPAAMVSAA